MTDWKGSVLPFYAGVVLGLVLGVGLQKTTPLGVVEASVAVMVVNTIYFVLNGGSSE